MFNPRARVSVVPVGPDRICCVVDDALLEPERLVERAIAGRDALLEAPHNAYPGLELRMPETVTAPLDAFFTEHFRRAMGARRVIRRYSRLSMVVTPPERLEPRQWICHRDRLQADPAEGIAASVLYLFHDPALGGTGFYTPRRPEPEIARLVHDSGAMAPAQFGVAYGIAPGYLTASNAWFEKTGEIAARWNRLIFYDGMGFHSADITAPERLSADPARGRLTLNGFFTCRRRLG